MSLNLKKALLAVGVGLLVLILIAAALIGPFLYAVLNNPFNDKRFDQAIWSDAEDNFVADNPRGLMTEDLRKRYLPVGMLKADVRKLLGKPISSKHVPGLLGQPNNSKYNDTNNMDCFFLGGRGDLGGGDYLLIHYDKGKRISRTELYIV